MKPSEALTIHREAIARIAAEHHVRNVRVFGSVMTQEDEEESDLDLLVDPTDDTSLMDIGAIRAELRQLLGIRVDVLTPNALPESFRDQVLKEASPL
ncbi:nucleotidyltransferase [Litchfieldella qijiaojingensis]|uniref:Nucleotidyltransferase n=1 Tax=Litchfieldella qijiaojingensis TaxID=980347 RepID=A0ABQ2ZA09_9GAMM|nr:nucleotidyltransferase family protein [Halomonas qijiaojingensis]GGY09596.1 nucleotidyltransferase [Halomonas qijiaojingensis]